MTDHDGRAGWRDRTPRGNGHNGGQHTGTSRDHDSVSGMGENHGETHDRDARGEKEGK